MTSSGRGIDPAYQVPALRTILELSRRPPSRGIQAYGVIRGRPVRTEVVEPGGDAPHYHVLLHSADGQAFDAAIDIYAREGAEVLFLVEPSFTPPEPEAWLALPTAATTIGAAGPGGLGIDYLRQSLVTRARMSLLPVDPTTVGSTLEGPVANLVDRAIADPSAEVFAFGKLYAAGQSGPNPAFGFRPDNGIHDIHLNQGDPGRASNPYEDGAFFVHYPSDGHWEAAFFAFQSQSFQAAAAP